MPLPPRTPVRMVLMSHGGSALSGSGHVRIKVSAQRIVSSAVSVRNVWRCDVMEDGLQKRPTSIAKETYFNCKRDLLLLQKRLYGACDVMEDGLRVWLAALRLRRGQIDTPSVVI